MNYLDLERGLQENYNLNRNIHRHQQETFLGRFHYHHHLKMGFKLKTLIGGQRQPINEQFKILSKSIPFHQ